MAKATTKPATTPEVVEATPDGAGTQPGEQIGSTPAEGVAAPEGGAFPEATPDDLPEQPDPDVNQPDASVTQMKINPKLARSRGVTS